MSNVKSRSLGVLLLGALFFTGLTACKPKPRPHSTALSDDQQGVIAYMRHPRLTGFDFAEQATGVRFHLEYFDRRLRVIYGTIARDDYRSSDFLNQLCSDTSQLEFAQLKGHYQQLGKYNYTDTSRLFFRFPAYLLRVDSTRILQKNFNSARYTLSMQEFRAFFQNNVLYNGPVLALTGEYQGAKPVAVANHSSTIAFSGEPSLQRLVHQLTDSMAPEEVRAQQLLDFVTQEIGYTGHGGVEIYNRPIEVLLSRKSDCSGKVVLYASLLEQAHIPYLLVYLPHHIAVAIPGNFLGENGLSFDHEGRWYHIAETTAEGFVIGKSRLNRIYSLDEIQYLQFPGKRTRLFDVGKGDSLEFLKKVESRK